MVRYAESASRHPFLFFLPFLYVAMLTALLGQSLDSQPGGGRTRKSDIPNSSRVYATGEVVMADATSLPGGLIVQLVCHDRVMDESPISPQGGFVLEAGKDPLGASDLDASVQGHPNSPQLGSWQAAHDAIRSVSVLNGCQVRLAPVPDLSANEIALGGIDLRTKPDVGTLIVQRGSSDRGSTTIDVSSLEVPSKARKAYEKAQKELAKSKIKYAKAIEYLEEATEEHPQFTDAWYLLGYCCQMDGDLTGARSAFEQTVQLDKNHRGANFELARYELDDGHWQEASAHTRLLVQLEAEQPQVLYFDGVAHFNLGKLDIAGESLNQLVDLGHGQSFPLAFFFLAVIEGESGNYEVAADYLGTFLDTTPEEDLPEDLKENAKLQLEMWRKQVSQQE